MTNRISRLLNGEFARPRRHTAAIQPMSVDDRQFWDLFHRQRQTATQLAQAERADG